MRAALALAALGAAVLVGSAGSAPTQTAQVSMPAKLFAPRDLDVLLGTTVTWRNADSTTHTVTADEDEFDSGFVRPGGTFAADVHGAGRVRLRLLDPSLHAGIRARVPDRAEWT